MKNHEILLTLSFLLLTTSIFMSCSPTYDEGDPINLKSSDYTYTLSESTNNFKIWTTPCTNKIRTNYLAPSNEESGIRISSAKNEYEPFQLVLGKVLGSVSITMDKFPNFGSGQKIKMYQVGFESGWAEALRECQPGESISLDGNTWNPIWISIYVPETAPKGINSTALHIKYGSETISIPVSVYVFDFSLPEDIHFASQFNKSISGEDDHNLLFEHRLTPKSATWPSGFRYDITWKEPYTEFYDEADQPEEYGIKYLAKKYIKGIGWNGVGYPNAMAFQFVDNNTPRPSSFAGVSRGADHFGTVEYNNAWKKYLGALNGYLVDNGYSDKVYYYVMNEPQGQDDYDVAAFLCKLTKSVAPNLRIAISEEPKKEIAEHPTHQTSDGSSYDIWMAEVQHYDQGYAWKRQRDYGEIVWFYSLPQDPEPFFNPTKVDNQGMNQRIISWVSWYHRARGWVYYDGGNFFDDNKPNIRLELLRESFEDYEYLYLANGNQHPVPDSEKPIDKTVKSVTTGLCSWTKSADALMKLRHELGLYIDGSTSHLPELEVEVVRPKGGYYINFQDKNGKPSDDPLVIDGKTYIKVGWDAYNNENHYGWSGYAVNNPNVAKYKYTNKSGYNEVQKSCIYDDYGKVNLFEFDLEKGEYEVSVGVGIPDKPTADKHNVTVEGVKFYDAVPDLATDEKTKMVNISDGKLSVSIGDAVGQYTFLAYINIVPVATD